MTLARGVYSRLPAGLQSVAVSLHGRILGRRRFGRAYEEFLPEILAGQWRTAQEWREYQLARLVPLVEGARRSVPYYRETLPARLPTSDLAELLHALPRLEKPVLRRNPEAFLSETVRAAPGSRRTTSGTTGSPLAIVSSPGASARVWAAMERFWRWAGVRRGDRRVSFTGNQVVAEHQRTGPFGRVDRANQRLMMSVYHLGSQTVDRYLDQIEEFRPDFMDGYPSAMVACAQRARDTGREIRMVACLPTAETLTPEHRRIIEEGFRTRVYNQYGSQEASALVTECPAGSLHVHPEIGIVEILDEEGRPVAPGETGELVLTGLTNFAMPLIRYRIGDLGQAVDPGARCPCGREMPMVAAVLGRQDDVVVTRDGRRIGMLSYNVFKWTEGIEASQIVQEEFDRFVLHIVPGRSFTQESVEVAIRALKERVGDDVRVEVLLQDALPRGANGKLRAVVSRVA